MRKLTLILMTLSLNVLGMQAQKREWPLPFVVYSTTKVLKCYIVAIAIWFANAHSTNCNAQISYNDYVEKCKDLYGVTLSFPKEKIEPVTQNDSGYDTFFFGEQDESKTWPVYHVAFYVKLSSHCFVCLEDVSVYGREDEKKNSTPLFDGILLNNSGLPYTHWYQYQDILSKQDKINEVREQNIKYVSDMKMLHRTKADEICIVNIPNINKVFCTNDTGINSLRLAYNDACYGIEYKKNGKSMTMLVFISGKKQKIGKYMEKISEFVLFE